jgi:electron transfer flavoprotein alpha subunit
MAAGNTAGILVFIEQRNGRVRRASLEALCEAARQIKGIGGRVTAILVAESGDTLVGDIAKYSPGAILLSEGPELKDYSTEAYANALAQGVKKVSPKYIFAANTALAKDLIPRVAARFNAPCLTDVMALTCENGVLCPTKPIYSGKVRAKFQFASDQSFLTLRANVFPLAESQNGAQPTVEKLPVPSVPIRAKVVETHAAQGTRVELSEASIIVSGGRGIKGPENWPVLQSLCDVLGAALGASRAVVDAGWIDHQHQVGQTGKTVSPQLYIACGISGAIQHLAGMSTSKVIVAINKDPEAPIYKQANYIVVGDCLEIVPKLTEEIRRLKESN